MSKKKTDVKISKAVEQDVSPEKKLINQREAREISVPDFLKGLEETGSDFAKYWKTILGVLQAKRMIRVKDLLPFAKELHAQEKKEAYKLNFIAGILRKFDHWQLILSLKSGGTAYYVCDLPGFYTPDEIQKLIPGSEADRILAHVTDKPTKLSEIAKLLYGDENDGNTFLETFLTYYQNLSLIKFNKKDSTYCLTPRGVELGVDSQSIKTLEATALENALFMRTEQSGKLPTSLAEVRDALKRDIANKIVPVTDLTKELGGGDLKLLFVGEIMYGSQFTDETLLEWILSMTDKPTLIITSGLVQGKFEVKNKAKTKGLTEEAGLDQIAVQFHAAGMLLDGLERMATSRVCVIQGDDDWRMADDYSTQMQLLEGKNPWKWGVDWSSFSGEMTRRLNNRELRRKFRIQWETIQTYMYRIGRSLLNKEEVSAKNGVPKSEYRLIMEIMVAKKNNFAYPKEYEKVVNVEALYGNIDKRIVTPDPLRLLVVPGEIRVVHNAGFSDITQYQNTIQHLDAIARHLGLSRNQLPWILADFHQENFYAEYLMGTWIMNLPGMQDTRPAGALTMQEWHTRILESKERRQNRVRKEMVSPSAVEMTRCEDGRIRFRILNNAVMKVLEEQKNKPERREVAVIGTDWQFGSITNWPELVAKFLDYGLYERKATRLYQNGDFIHGNIYPQHNAESRPMRLTSLHAQQKFSFELVMPIILDAPNLQDIAAWLGNHEWNNIGSKLGGDSPLTFFETGLLGVLMERKRLGIENSLQRAMTVSRIRWRDTHNPQGDIVNWPFFADTICGFKVAIQHMWQPMGADNTAADAKFWLKRMARASRSIDLLIGGHKHCVWMAQLGDKLCVSAGAAASQSGYELARGLMSTVMFTLVEFSNRDGITIEFVPWEFLQNHYKFQCPALKGKDDLFLRPAPGTKEYQQGKMAPYIEDMIDNLTRYLEV
jgi:hypothetical protein